MGGKPSKNGLEIKNKNPTTEDTETPEKDGRIFIKQPKTEPFTAENAERAEKTSKNYDHEKTNPNRNIQVGLWTCPLSP